MGTVTYPLIWNGFFGPHSVPSVTGEDGRASLEIILAIYRAAAETAAVRLPIAP